MNQPTIFNPQYVIELRNIGNLCFGLADSIEAISRASPGTGTGVSTTTTGIRRRGPHTTATKKLMRLAAQNRKLGLHQGGAGRKVA